MCPSGVLYVFHWQLKAGWVDKPRIELQLSTVEDSRVKYAL